MDPAVGPVTIQISGTSAALIARLSEVMATDGGSVMMRALGLLDLALKSRREGKKLGFYDPSAGTLSEVAF